MTQELTRYEPVPLAPVVTDQQIDLIKRTVAKDATDAELQLYLYDCQRHGVHPLDKLLHFTKRSNKYTPITSIDLLRSRAADTGELAGIDDPQYQGEAARPDFTATCTIWRIVQGQRYPFSATARWSEYKPDQDHMWRKMPYLMLGKCAEALALRKAFPRQLAGLYAQEEMDQAGGRVNTTTGEIGGQAPAPTNGKKRPPSRDSIIDRLTETFNEAIDLGIAIEDARVDNKDDAQLIAAGQKLRAAIDAAKKAAMQETADLPL